MKRKRYPETLVIRVKNHTTRNKVDLKTMSRKTSIFNETTVL